MSRRILIPGAALVLLITAVGLTVILMARADAAHSGAPSITGTITNVSLLDEQGVILVDERPQDQGGSNKASITINAATRIYRGRVGASTNGWFGDLRDGQLVEQRSEARR